MLVVLDIETVQASRSEWEEVVGLGEKKRKEKHELSEDDLFSHAEAKAQRERDDEAYAKSSFDGTFSKIVCIGVIFLTRNMEPRGAVSWYGPNEKELLKQFWARLGKDRPSLYVTHNGLGFDLPFIKKRSIIHQVKPSVEITLARFRTEPVFDTMAVWSNWDNRGWVKLDVLARALGVESKSGSGSQVADMWAQGQGKEIAEYCLQDTYVTYGCYCRMKYLTPLSRQILFLHKQLIEVK